MDREARILQQRVHVPPIERHRPKPQERVGGQQREQLEPHRCTAEHPDHPGAQRGGQVASEQPDRRAADCQDQAPEQDRALVIPPGAGDLVDHRLQRMGILGHVQHREIVDHRGPDQAAIGGHQGDQLAVGQGGRRRHQSDVAGLGAPERDDELRGGKGDGERQGEMTQFRDHPPAFDVSGFFGISVFQVEAGGGGLPSSGFQWPVFFRASSTSFGI